MLGFNWFKEWMKRRNASDREKQMRQKLEQLTTLRDKQFTELRSLADREEQLLREGRIANGKIAKQRVAAFIVDVRQQSKIIGGKVQAYSRMMRVIRSYLANVDIVEHRSELEGLPNAEELSEIAVNAESALEELTSQTDTLDVIGIPSLEATEEEAAILAELEGETDQPTESKVPDTITENAEPDREAAKQPYLPPRERA